MKRPLGLLLLALPALALADITGVYQLLDGQRKEAGTLIVQMKDARHIRYDMQGGSQGTVSILLVGDGVYMLTPQGTVMDMDMVGALAGAFMTPQAKAAMQKTPRVEATGRRETVAGLKGEVWRWSEGGHAGEAVLSDDPRARKLGEALEQLGDRMEVNSSSNNRVQ
ncbi:MAG: hypothetical protein ABWU16_07990 [Halothiobacillaceae bacterium]